MTERDQWRFQWPDGTWIRWNAQTQSWEKEEPSPATEEAAESPPAPSQEQPREVPRPIPAQESEPSTEGAGWKPRAASAPTPVPSSSEAPETVERDEVPTTPEPSGWTTPQPAIEEPKPDEEPRDEEPVEAERPPTERRTRRPMVDDVLPPRAEPDRPGGSLWPTVIAAIIVGLAVGLLLSSIIR